MLPKDASRSLALNSAVDYWGRHGEQITARVLNVADQAARRGKSAICDDRNYQEQVVDPLWIALPCIALTIVPENALASRPLTRCS